jgi:aminopeptidase N
MTMQERTTVLVREAEARAALAEREARVRVSRMEMKSVVALTSARGKAEGFARRIALVQGELANALQARDIAEVNSWSLSGVAADTDRWWKEAKRECRERVQELTLL